VIIVRYDPSTMESLEALVDELAAAIGRGTHRDPVPELPEAVRERLARAPADLAAYLIRAVDAAELPRPDDEALGRKIGLLGGLGDPAGLDPLLGLVLRVGYAEGDLDGPNEIVPRAIWRAVAGLVAGRVADAIAFCERHRAHPRVDRLVFLLVDSNVVHDQLFDVIVENLPRHRERMVEALGLYGDLRAVPHLLASLSSIDRTVPKWEDTVRAARNALGELGAHGQMTDEHRELEAEANRLIDEKMEARYRRWDEEDRVQRDLVEARAEAACSTTAADRLRELAAHPDDLVRGTVARFAAQVELLETLATDPAASVRAATANNPHTPRPTMDRLIADPDDEVRAVVALSQMALPSDLAQLAGDPTSRVRRAVAVKAALLEDAPIDLVLRLAADPDADVRRELVTDNAPRWLLKRLAKDPDFTVRRAATEALAPDRPRVVHTAPPRPVPIRPHQLADGEVVFGASAPERDDP
jgi:hypothetical protein